MKKESWLCLIFPCFIFIVRTGTGFVDGSFALGLLGIWGFYGWISRFSGLVPFRKPGLAVRLGLVLRLGLVTFSLGMFLESAREFFRIWMGFENRAPGTLSLVTGCLTLLLWEGGVSGRKFYREEYYSSKSRVPGGVIDFCLALFVTLTIGSVLFLQKPYPLLEASLGALLALSLVLRGIFEALKETQELFPFRESKTQA